MSRIDITADRIVRDNVEGYRADVYDDNTGKPIQLPVNASGRVGVPTVGYGCAVKAWSEPFSRAVLELQLSTEFDVPLSAHDWYNAPDEIRGSVVLEAAFNLGVSGLVDGFPNFVAAMERRDYVGAAVELHVHDPVLDTGRYARLRRILASGVDE